MISPLEALHPAGRVERLLIVGERCPPGLAPPGRTGARTNVDLAVIAPSAAEVMHRRWLDRAAAAAATALADDGLVYALLPRLARPRAAARLERVGLLADSRVVHFPGTGLPRYLIPLARQPWRYALTRQIDAHPGARRALVTLESAPLGAPVLNVALPTVALIARRPGADPPAAWTGRLPGGTRQTAQAIVATSWRGASGPTVLVCFADGEGAPWGLAKLTPSAEREARMLERLGDAARRAGARVPRLLASGQAAGTTVLVESVVTGRSAAELLMARPGRLVQIVTSIAEWQRRWNVATSVAANDRFGHEVLSAAEELADVLPGGAAYRSWLATRCDSLARDGIRLVARHNDLTMWNITVCDDHALGIRDWAEAEEAGLPLTDFFYAVADAAAAADRYRSRLQAVRDCFSSGGRHAAAVAPLQQRLQASLGLTPHATELCFHACWLRHALNERRARGDGPFIEVARWLARRALDTVE